MPTIQFGAGYYLRIASQWNVIYIFQEQGLLKITSIFYCAFDWLFSKLSVQNFIRWEKWQ